MKRLLFLGACFTVVLGSIASLLQSVDVSASSRSNSVSVAIPPALQSINEIRFEQEQQRDSIADLSDRLDNSGRNTEIVVKSILDAYGLKLEKLSHKIDKIQKAQLNILETIKKENKKSTKSEYFSVDYEKVSGVERGDTDSNIVTTRRAVRDESQPTAFAATPLAAIKLSEASEPEYSVKARATSNVAVADGIAAYNAGAYSDAYRIWKELASNGNPQAQYFLGAILFEGKGVAKNLKEARDWLEIAHQNGFSRAESMIRRINKSLSEVSYSQESIVRINLRTDLVIQSFPRGSVE